MPTINKPTPKPDPRTGDSYNRERRRIYNTTRWRRLRALKQAAAPLCELCLQQGRITPAEDIHHRTSFMTAPTRQQREQLAYDWQNLMSLCKQCHQKLHNSAHR